MLLAIVESDSVSPFKVELERSGNIDLNLDVTPVYFLIIVRTADHRYNESSV